METYHFINFNENHEFCPLDLFIFRGNKQDVISVKKFVNIDISEGEFTHFGIIINCLIIPNLELNTSYILYFKISKSKYGLKIKKIKDYIRKYIYYDDLSNPYPNALFTKLKNNPFNTNYSSTNDIIHNSALRTNIRKTIEKIYNYNKYPIAKYRVMDKLKVYNLIIEIYKKIGYIDAKKNYNKPNEYLNDLDIFPNIFQEIGFIII
jgi:hypothetical protein